MLTEKNRKSSRINIATVNNTATVKARSFPCWPGIFIEAAVDSHATVEILSNVRRSVFVTSDSSWPPSPVDDEAWSKWLNQFADTVFRGVPSIGDISRWSLGTYTPKTQGPIISEEDTPNAEMIRIYKTPLEFLEDLLRKTSNGSPDSLVLIAYVDASNEVDMLSPESSFDTLSLSLILERRCSLQRRSTLATTLDH